MTANAAVNVLQWGHGDEAVEEATATPALHGPEELQWGHGDEAVEEFEEGPGPVASDWLQWGHGDEAVEEAGTSACL